MKNLINHTNTKLNNWYNNAKLDYRVIGNGTARIEGDKFMIDYIENGKFKTWSTCYYGNEEQDFFFNVWMEEG